MDRDSIIFGTVLGGMALLVGGAYFAARRDKRRQADVAARHEALFKSAFPELQPYFHPANVWEYVRARRGRGKDGKRWARPAGFAAAGVAAAEFSRILEREQATLLDERGAKLAEFLYENTAEGAVLRVGRGKLTAVLGDANPRVRYWHPEREFKWSRGKGWVFTLPALDARSDSDTGMSSGSSSGFTSSSTSSGAAPAPLESGGGTFDGGGASAGWDDGSGSSSSSSTSSTSSTAY